MTRQKKEILKQIGQMERSIQIDLQLGFSVAPAGAFDRVYEEIYKLQEELAGLRHYASADEMFRDTRGNTHSQTQDMDLPW